MNDIFSIETGNNFHADHRFRLIQQGLRVIINYYKRRAEGVVHIKSNEKFTQRAELAIENARAAAGELGHGYVGTEHLLLGIIAEKDSLGARILRSQGLDGERLRGIIIRRSGVGSPAKPSQGLTERAQRAVERAAEEARCLQQSDLLPEYDRLKIENERLQMMLELANRETEALYCYGSVHNGHDNAELEYYRSECSRYENSTCWKITKPIRVIMDFLKKIFRR